MEQTDLYRHYDKDDALLYLGVSNCTARRTACHRSRSPWAANIARTTVETFQTRKEALAAEMLAIANEAPLFNLQGRLVDRKMAKKIFEQFGPRSVHEIMPDKIYETAAGALLVGVGGMDLWEWMYNTGVLEVPIKRARKRKVMVGLYGRDLLRFVEQRKAKK